MKEQQPTSENQVKDIRPEGPAVSKTHEQPVSQDDQEAKEHQKEEWQRGISAGNHEKMNASFEDVKPEIQGSSSIPLDKDNTMEQD